MRELYLVADPRHISPYLLWHEMIHAVSHRNSKDGGPQFSYTEEEKKEKDHMYINWADNCVGEEGLPKLAVFEDIVRQSGKNPSAQELGKAQNAFATFANAAQSSIYHTLPTGSQKNELRNMMGFHCLSPEAIMNEYLKLGYAPEYFKIAAEIRLFEPHGVLDVTNYPGDKVDITIQFNTINREIRK